MMCPPASAGSLKDLVSLTLRAAGLVGLPAQPADSHQAAPAPVIVRGEHVFHDACSRLLCGLRKHPGGCDQPAAACEVHHVKHKANGGHTSVTDCVLLCAFHHQVVIHRWGWTLVLNPDGTTTAWNKDKTKVLHSHGPPVRPG